jgi:quercetin dioxygenase-like cupin family protein
VSDDSKRLSTAQVFTLADLVAYQDGSVVSRTIIDKPSGTVTLFAFGDGQGLSEHQAPFDALVCVLDGKASASVSGVAHEVPAGGTIILPANKPHSLKAVTRFKMLLVMIKS